MSVYILRQVETMVSNRYAGEIIAQSSVGDVILLFPLGFV